MPAALARFAACVGPGLAGHVDLRRRARAQHAPVQGLDARSFVKMGVEPGVDLGEGGRQVGYIVFAERLARQRHVDLVHLTEEPHVGGAGDGDIAGSNAGLRQQPSSFRLEVREQAVHRAEIHLFHQAGQRARLLEADRRDQETECRRRPGRRRHDDLAHPQLARHPRRMGRPGAAQRDHCVTPGVVSLLDDVDPCRARHVLAHDFVVAPRRLHRRQAQGLADFVDCRLRCGPVQRHSAAEEKARIQIAQKKVGVGNRRLRSPVSIASRPRVGAGAAGPHLQQAQAVDARDRSPSGTDLDHVDHRRLDRQAAALLEAVDPRRLHHRGNIRAATLDQAGLRRRPTHVERDHVGFAYLATEECRRHSSAGRPGFQEPDGKRRRDRRRRQASGRLHKVKLALKPLRLNGLYQAPHVAPHQGLYVGVRHCCRGPIVFAQLRLHGARQRHRNAREPFLDQRSDRLLVGRVLIGVQKADGDCLDAVLDQVRDLAARLFQIHWNDDIAVPAQALHHLAPQSPEHQRLREIQKKVMNVVALLGPHLQNVAEPFRRQQADRRARSFDQCVGDQRRSVDQVPDLTEFQARRRQQFSQALQRPRRGVIGRRQAFVQADLSALPVEQNEIGKGPADVESKAVAFWVIGHFPCPPEYDRETL